MRIMNPLIATLFFLVLQNPVNAIVHGVKTNAKKYNSVVFLEIGNEEGFCTGTFIGPQTVLTAAHCVQDYEVFKDGEVNIDVKLVSIIRKKGKTTIKRFATATKVQSHPLFYNILTSGKYDVALITFPKGHAPGISKLSKRVPKKNQTITMVGFGSDISSMKNFAQRSGIKRLGKNKIQSVSTRSSYFYANGSKKRNFKKAINYLGDSGGPVFYRGRIVGVMSEATDNNEGSFININHKLVKEFIFSTEDYVKSFREPSFGKVSKLDLMEEGGFHDFLDDPDWTP